MRKSVLIAVATVSLLGACRQAEQANATASASPTAEAGAKGTIPAAAPVTAEEAQRVFHERHEGMEDIGKATKAAMREALGRLPQRPDHLVIDALSLRDVDLPQRAIIDGDAISASIAAASIVAKVTRDRICAELDERYPPYGFARNKGYGTQRHLDALLTEGPCEWHRRSFAPVRMLLAGEQLSLDLFMESASYTEEELEPDDEAG